MTNIDDLHITMDSFGADCPNNWEEIAEYLNHLIDAVVILDESGVVDADAADAVADIWERYCAGQIDGAPEAVYDDDFIFSGR